MDQHIIAVILGFNVDGKLARTNINIKEDNSPPLYTKERCHIEGVIYIKKRRTQRNDVNKGIVRKLYNLVLRTLNHESTSFSLCLLRFDKEDEGEEEMHEAQLTEPWRQKR